MRNEETTNLTLDDVQAALAAMPSKSDAIALLKEHGGVDRLSQLDANKFAAVCRAAKAKTRPKTVADLDSTAIYDRWNKAKLVTEETPS